MWIAILCHRIHKLQTVKMFRLLAHSIYAN